MSSFVVIDFETANPNRSSICQVGIVKYNNGCQIDRFESLVNPEEPFSTYNTNIHGITKEAVKKSPKFHEIYPNIIEFIGINTILSHSLFDLQCMQKVTDKYDLLWIENHWIDAIEILKIAIPDLADGSYKLQSLAKIFKINTKAHDALDDAITCGLIINKALVETNTKIEDWLGMSSINFIHSIKKNTKVKKITTANPSGKYFGNSLVLTGNLISISRDDANELASTMGFKVSNSVSKKTNFMVVGIQDLIATKGKENSTKELAAYKLISEGIPIKIINEDQFINMCKVSN